MPLFRSKTDRLFLRFCRTGDAQALGVVFDRTSPELLRIACYLSGNRSDAEDLVQRTFLAAIENRGAFDGSRQALPWLLGILTNHSRRLRRERARSVPAPMAEPAVDPSADAEAVELRERLETLRDSLGEPYAEVLRLHLEDGLNAKEIAARLQRPAGTVRTQLMRALDQLRQRLPIGFMAGLSPWLPTGGALAATANLRATVLAAARRITAPGSAAAAAGPAAILGGILMSKKVLFATPLVVAAFGFLGQAIWQGDAPPAGPGGDLAAVARADGPAVADADTTPAAAGSAVQREALARAAAPDALDPGFARVQVRVRWADDRAPAAGVGVFAENGQDLLRRDDVSAGDGNATLAHLAPGRWRIGSTLTADRVDVEVTADTTTTVDLLAERAAIARGQVLDQQQRPVAGARIWLSIEGDPFRGHEVASSDANGRFAVPVRSAHHLGARKAGHAPSHLQVVDAGRPDTLEPVLRLLHAGGSLHGQVRDAHGKPLAWVKLLVGEEIPHLTNSNTAPTHEHLPRGNEVVTDRDGFYVTDAPAGACPVFAWAPDCAPFAGGVDVPAGGVARLDIHLTPGARVAGRVTGPDGPIGGAQVRWRTEFQFAHAATRSAADGGFELTGLPAGAETLVAEHDGATTRALLQLTAGTTTTWDPVLAGTGSIRGHVVGSDGKPRAGVTLSAWLEFTEKSHATSAEDGSFELAAVGDEPVTVDVTLDFQQLRRIPDVRPGTHDLRIEIGAADLPSARLRGRILDANGHGVGATLVPWREGSNQALNHQSDAATGAFDIGPLAPGRYRLSVESATHGRQSGGSFELRPDERRDLGDLTVQLPGACEIRVTIDGRPARGGMVFVLASDGSWSDTLHIDNGLARHAALRPGRHVAMAEFQGRFQGADLVIESGAVAHLALDLQPTGRAEVRLQEPDGTTSTQREANLTARRPDGSTAGMFALAVVDQMPVFLVDLPPGRYHFEVTTTDGRRATLDHEIRAAHATSPATLALPAR